ncbi:MAG: hypothetical protein M3167_00250 [Acidobacteriota bacterium]|nr:hypothetical protein [Acidobacteriota bacterium]
MRDLHRRFARHLGHERTLARWRRDLSPVVRSFPSFSVEALGLSHVHLVLFNPDGRWQRFPYAVELVWGSPDFVQRALYLHCLVPAQHVPELVAFVESLRSQGWCSEVVVFHSYSGSQHLRACDHPVAGDEFRPPADPALLRRHPLVVPVLAECWNHDATLPGLWRAIYGRLGTGVRAYLPRQRLLRVNGKQHVRAALQALLDAGLFRQQILRRVRSPESSVECLLVGTAAGDRLVELIAALRETATTTETYWSAQGAVLVRVTGTPAVLQLLLELGAGNDVAALVVFGDFRRTREGTCQFSYELLFDPKTGWRFDPDGITEHLTR